MECEERTREKVKLRSSFSLRFLSMWASECEGITCEQIRNVKLNGKQTSNFALEYPFPPFPLHVSFHNHASPSSGEQLLPS